MDRDKVKSRFGVEGRSEEGTLRSEGVRVRHVKGRSPLYYFCGHGVEQREESEPGVRVPDGDPGSAGRRPPAEVVFVVGCRWSPPPCWFRALEQSKLGVLVFASAEWGEKSRLLED